MCALQRSGPRRRESFDLQAKELILPLSVLEGEYGRFSNWTRKVARTLPDRARIALEDALDGVEDKWFKTIDDYHFPGGHSLRQH